MKNRYLRALAVTLLALTTTFALTEPASAATRGVPALSTAAIAPQIQSGPCTNGTLTWVNLDVQNVGHICFGFRGTTPYLGDYALEMTTGNNYGFVTYNWNLVPYNNVCFGIWPDGTTCQTDFPFFQGTYGTALVQYIDIVGWR